MTCIEMRAATRLLKDEPFLKVEPSPAPTTSATPCCSRRRNMIRPSTRAAGMASWRQNQSSGKPVLGLTMHVQGERFQTKDNDSVLMQKHCCAKSPHEAGELARVFLATQGRTGGMVMRSRRCRSLSRPVSHNHLYGTFHSRGSHRYVEFVKRFRGSSLRILSR